MKINYIKGDATNPVGNDPKIICHICNDIGAWGAGFVMALSKRWKEPERDYRQWFKKQSNFYLGQVQFVPVENNLVVCNMIAQSGTISEDNPAPIRYGALQVCLQKVAKEAKKTNASIVGPKFGSGLSGGSWPHIEQIINDELCFKDIPVTIYSL